MPYTPIHVQIYVFPWMIGVFWTQIYLKVINMYITTYLIEQWAAPVWCKNSKGIDLNHCDVRTKAKFHSGSLW